MHDQRTAMLLIQREEERGVIQIANISLILLFDEANITFRSSG